MTRGKRKKKITQVSNIPPNTKHLTSNKKNRKNLKSKRRRARKRKNNKLAKDISVEIVTVSSCPSDSSTSQGGISRTKRQIERHLVKKMSVALRTGNIDEFLKAYDNAIAEGTIKRDRLEVIKECVRQKAFDSDYSGGDSDDTLHSTKNDESSLEEYDPKFCRSPKHRDLDVTIKTNARLFSTEHKKKIFECDLSALSDSLSPSPHVEKYNTMNIDVKNSKILPKCIQNSAKNSTYTNNTDSISSKEKDYDFFSLLNQNGGNVNRKKSPTSMKNEKHNNIMKIENHNLSVKETTTAPPADIELSTQITSKKLIEMESITQITPTKLIEMESMRAEALQLVEKLCALGTEYRKKFGDLGTNRNVIEGVNSNYWDTLKTHPKLLSIIGASASAASNQAENSKNNAILNSSENCVVNNSILDFHENSIHLPCVENTYKDGNKKSHQEKISKKKQVNENNLLTSDKQPSITTHILASNVNDQAIKNKIRNTSSSNNPPEDAKTETASSVVQQFDLSEDTDGRQSDVLNDSNTNVIESSISSRETEEFRDTSFVPVESFDVNCAQNFLCQLWQRGD